MNEPVLKLNRVLIVDDDELVCRSMKSSLALLGFECVLVKGPEEALAHIEGELPNLIIIDFMLKSSMNGAELAEKIRQSHPELPLVLTSGYDEHSIRTGGEVSANLLFLQKPFSLNDLSEAIEEMLGRDSGNPPNLPR